MTLSSEELKGLAAVLEARPRVRRAVLVNAEPKTLLAFEYDERLTSVEEARVSIQELAAQVAIALGPRASDFGFWAGGPEEIALVVEGGEVVYERA